MRLPVPSSASPYSVLLADAYDDVIGRDFFTRLREAFERIIARHHIPFSSAADLGCGTGLFARYLNALWKVPVFGVDLSPAMLDVAASNCRDANVTLLHQDIRRLRLPRPVDLMTSNFDTVNHLVEDGDLPALFRRVYHQLRPGGHFIFDFITPCKPPEGVLLHHRCARGRCRQVLQHIRWVPARRMLLYDIVFRDPAQPRSRIEFHHERAYEPREVAAWLMDCGFVILDVLDAATLRRATTCPARAIVIAHKPRIDGEAQHRHRCLPHRIDRTMA